MDQLVPQHVPVYQTSAERERLWNRCTDRGVPVVAVRDARRGFIVRYDLGHLGAELAAPALRELRERTAGFQTYPTADTAQFPAGTDPLSQAESLGGEAGTVSGDLHAPTESSARELAARLSAIVFDDSNWVRAGDA